MDANKTTAGIDGFGYLIFTFTSAFSKALLRSKLIESGDSPAITNRFMASEWSFRTGSFSDLIVLACNMVVALTLYVLLIPVNKSILLFAAFFRLVHTAIDGVNLLIHFFTSLHFSNADYLTVSEPDRLHLFHPNK